MGSKNNNLPIIYNRVFLRRKIINKRFTIYETVENHKIISVNIIFHPNIPGCRKGQCLIKSFLQFAFTIAYRNSL